MYVSVFLLPATQKETFILDLKCHEENGTGGNDPSSPDSLNEFERTIERLPVIFLAVRVRVEIDGTLQGAAVRIGIAHWHQI